MIAVVTVVVPHLFVSLYGAPSDKCVVEPSRTWCSVWLFLKVYNAVVLSLTAVIVFSIVATAATVRENRWRLKCLLFTSWLGIQMEQ